MPYNGSGTFTRVYDWTDDRDNGVKIRADRFDAEMDGMATGLSTAITKDGQTTITADIPMNSKKFTGLAAGTAAGHSIRYEQVREKRAADYVLYVRTDGSDSNTGLANTAGAALLTLQAAVDKAKSIDTAGYDFYIMIADGTYTGAVSVSGKLIGNGRLKFIGNTTTPANVVISVTSNNAFTLYDFCNVWIAGVKVQTTTSGDCINLTAGAQLRLDEITFGAAGGAGGHMNIGFGAQVTAFANYTISGGAAFHTHTALLGSYNTGTITITLSGTPAFSAYFAGGSAGGMSDYRNVTFSGSATGSRFTFHKLAFMDPPSASLTALPGNSAGVEGSGAIYYMGENVISHITQGPDGDATTPAFSFSGDTNSGLYRIGADNIGMTLGGTKRVDYATTLVNFSTDVTWDGATWTTWSPTISSVGGSLTTTSVGYATYKKYGKLVTFRLKITFTDIGTATTAVKFTLPVASASAGPPIMGINLSTAKALTGACSFDNSTTGRIYLYDGTFPVANGQDLYVSGFYES